MSTSASRLDGNVSGGRYADVYAASLSLLCLVHCLALPLVASLLPLAGQLSENELVHRILVLLAVPATVWVVWKSLRAINVAWPFIALAVFGLVLLLLSAFAPVLSPFEEPLTVVGAMALASAHLWRWSQHSR